MEEKKKGRKGLVVLVVILLLACIGMGCYIAYDKLINKDAECTKTTEKEKKKVATPKENEQPTEKDVYQVLELSPVGGIAVVYNGEVYVNIYDSTPRIDEIYGEDMFQTLVSTRKNYKEYDFGELVVTTAYVNLGGTGKWLKLNISNVEYIYNNQYGQGLVTPNPKYGIVMINSDNTVSYINTKDLIEGNTNPTRLDATDISSVVAEEETGLVTYLVRSDGTKIDVNTLIK